jgi:hypothetical protein
VRKTPKKLTLKLGSETLRSLDRSEIERAAGGLTLTCFRSCGGWHTCFCHP